VQLATASPRGERPEGAYLRTFGLELKEQLARTLAAFVTSILAGPRGYLGVEEAAEPPLRQIGCSAAGDVHA
jgi:hypothetical protein